MKTDRTGAPRATAARGQPRSGASSAAATISTRPGSSIIVVVVAPLEEKAERLGEQDQHRAGEEAVERVPGEQARGRELRMRLDQELRRHGERQHGDEYLPDHSSIPRASASGSSA